MKSKKTMLKRIMSIFLSLMTMAFSVSFAYASTPVALAEANITVYPTASGEMFFGQKVGDWITISGGEVQYNGTVVPGHFEFTNPDYYPDSANNAERASLTFVPQDTQAYTGFSIRRSRNVTFKVKKATPVFVDESQPPVATKIEAGAKIITSIISGGQVINPYNPEEPYALKAKWRWKDEFATVSESGYYTARLVAGTGYEVLEMDIYIGIAGDVPETKIEEKPVIAEFEYNPNITWKDVPVVGGKAVSKATGLEVKGKFEVTDKWKNLLPRTAVTEIDIKFTPNDETEALPNEFKIPVTVKKATPKFVNENGEEIVPELTVPYGTAVSYDVANALKKFVNFENPSVDYDNLDHMSTLPGFNTKPGLGTHEFRVRVSGDSNYEPVILTFKLTVVPVKITPVITGNKTLQIISTDGKQHNPEGTFDIYVNGAKYKSVKYGEKFEWVPTSSGTYELKAVYNPTENDRYIIDDIYRTYEDIKLSWKLSATGRDDKLCVYGDRVTVAAPALDPSRPEKPYYAFEKWSVVQGNPQLSEESLNNSEISFNMPDEDVKLEAVYKFSFELFFKYVFETITSFFQNAWSAILLVFNSIIAKL